MQLSTKVAAPLVPLLAQVEGRGDGNMAAERSRVQIMRCGLKFLCATNKVVTVRDGCAEFEALILAL